MNYTPLHFFNEPIEVHFSQPPLLEKKPGCPQAFTWRGRLHEITEMLSEWHDYQRRGRMAKNMRPSHAAVAAQRGSWGVGQHYFRVRTLAGQVFDIYYDRAPRDAGHRKGAWFIEKELQPEQAA
jgi:hypothetical protein